MVTNSLLNLGLVLTPILMCELKDHSDYFEFRYYWVTRFSLMLSLIGLGFGFLVWYVDRVGTGMLAMNIEQRSAHNNRSEIK